jgi:hypothetical protein
MVGEVGEAREKKVERRVFFRALCGILILPSHSFPLLFLVRHPLHQMGVAPSTLSQAQEVISLASTFVSELTKSDELVSTSALAASGRGRVKTREEMRKAFQSGDQRYRLCAKCDQPYSRRTKHECRKIGAEDPLIHPPSAGLLASKAFPDQAARELFMTQWYNPAPGTIEKRTAGHQFREAQKHLFSTGPQKLEAAKQRLALGAQDAKTIRHVAFGIGGGRTIYKHKSEDDRAKNLLLASLRNRFISQVEYLVFQTEYLRGCNVATCPLAQDRRAPQAHECCITQARRMEIIRTADKYFPLPIPATHGAISQDEQEPLTMNWQTLRDLFDRMEVSKASEVPQCLLNWDHIGSQAYAAFSSERQDLVVLEKGPVKEKTGIMRYLSPEQRDKERLICRTVCYAHHLMHTIKQLDLATSADATSTIRRAKPARVELAKRKMQSGCQFPSHDSTPWASAWNDLIEAHDGELPAPALVVSHLRRGALHNRSNNANERAEVFQVDLEAGTASVFCFLCDAVFTGLERIHLHPTTPLSIQQLPIIESYCPEFVIDFQEITQGVDWRAEANSISKKISKSRKRSRPAE